MENETIQRIFRGDGKSHGSEKSSRCIWRNVLRQSTILVQQSVVRGAGGLPQPRGLPGLTTFNRKEISARVFPSRLRFQLRHRKRIPSGAAKPLSKFRNVNRIPFRGRGQVTWGASPPIVPIYNRFKAPLRID